MAKPGNILNQKPDANNKLDARIKFYAIFVSSFTLFYLVLSPHISITQEINFFSFFKITSLQLTKVNFEKTLLFLNAIVWARLLYRVIISYQYNKYYGAAKRIISIESEEPSTKVQIRLHNNKIDKLYNKKSKPLRYLDKYFVGLIIPLIVGMFILGWLIKSINPAVETMLIVKFFISIILGFILIFIASLCASSLFILVQKRVLSCWRNIHCLKIIIIILSLIMILPFIVCSIAEFMKAFCNATS